MFTKHWPMSALLWKESLDSDGQQFHQYQQNEESALMITTNSQFVRSYALNIVSTIR